MRTKARSVLLTLACLVAMPAPAPADQWDELAGKIVAQEHARLVRRLAEHKDFIVIVMEHPLITDRVVLWREVRSIRKRGFAESKGELFAGGGALAAPIKDFGGRTIAVLDILTPEHRYTDEHRERCIAILLTETQRASERLGHRPDVAISATAVRQTTRRLGSR